MPTEYLVHYGVTGMKWGIQKKQEELYDKKLAYKQKKEARRESYKTMTTSQRKAAKAKDQAEDEKDIQEMEVIQEEIKELTNQLAQRYENIRLDQLNAQRSRDRAERIIRKFRIKRATII